MVKNEKSDFNAGELAKKTGEHTIALEELQARVGTNENFGKTFKLSTKDSKAIDEAIEKIIINLLENNVSTQQAITTLVSQIDKQQMKNQLMGFGKIVLWVVSLIVAALVGAFINSLF